MVRDNQKNPIVTPTVWECQTKINFIMLLNFFNTRINKCILYILSKKRNAHVIQQEFFQVWSLYDWDNDIWLKSAICQKSNILSKKRNAHVIQQEFFQVWSLYDWDNDIWLKSAICQKSKFVC